MNSKPESKYHVVLLRETVTESWLKDLTTFGGVGFLLWLNHTHLGDTTIGYIIAAVFGLMFVPTKLMRNKDFKKAGYFDDVESAKAFLDSRP